MIFLFWLFIFSIFYTYIGYPIVLKFAADYRRMPKPQKEDIEPHVTIVVAAYNEEKAIAAKIENLLALDYDADRRDIVVVSDCSDDQTDDIVRSHSDKGVRLHRMEERGGKIAGYKSVLPTLDTDIVVFSDATSKLELQSLRLLVKGFADESIGCVVGRLKYIDPNKAEIAKGEQTYWSYETRIKNWEENVYSLLSVSGTFYGIRKDLFPVDMADDLADDLIAVLNCVGKGKRVVSEKDAVCREDAIHADDAEMNKRWRITVQNLRGLMALPKIFNPFHYGWYMWMIVSHKLYRVLVPLLLIGTLLTNVFLTDGSEFFKWSLLMQIVFYMIAAVGAIWKEGRPKPINIVYYFCVTNLSILLGIIKFLKGEKVAVWDTER